MTYFGNQKHGPLSARDKMASDGAWLAGLGYVKTRSPITVFRNRSKNMTLFDSFLRSVVHHSQSQRFLWWGCSCVGLTFGSRCRLCSCASNRGARCRYTRARDSFSLDALITRNESNHPACVCLCRSTDSASGTVRSRAVLSSESSVFLSVL